MCTMSIIKTRDEILRVAFNRDESLTRATALPPRSVRFGGCSAIMPIDPQSGGTWISVNEFGLILALLNVNQPGFDRHIGCISRGTIIPSLIHNASSIEAIQDASNMDFNSFSPFRLVAIDGDSIGDLTWNGRHARMNHGPLETPLMFASSGLGDSLVERPRRELFDQIIASGQTRLAQDAFHKHSWPDRPHLSVSMSRANARTVSWTVVELGPGEIEMSYTDHFSHDAWIALQRAEAVLA
jgi:uncharacterized protein with NRDE domain